eukprot:scaffold15761_cov154-Skeletonema_marinoi.AAC.3
MAKPLDTVPIPTYEGPSPAHKALHVIRQILEDLLSNAENWQHATSFQPPPTEHSQVSHVSILSHKIASPIGIGMLLY